MWRYNESGSTPFPILDDIEIFNSRIEGVNREKTSGKIDSGAEKCFLSEALIKKLKLIPMSEVFVEDIHGTRVAKKTYLLDLKINDCFSESIEVVTTELKETIIIGLAVLNELTLLLHGKQKYTKILDENEVKKLDS